MTTKTDDKVLYQHYNGEAIEYFAFRYDGGGQMTAIATDGLSEVHVREVSMNGLTQALMEASGLHAESSDEPEVRAARIIADAIRAIPSAKQQEETYEELLRERRKNVDLQRQIAEYGIDEMRVRALTAERERDKALKQIEELTYFAKTSELERDEARRQHHAACEQRDAAHERADRLQKRLDFLGNISIATQLDEPTVITWQGARFVPEALARGAQAEQPGLVVSDDGDTLNWRGVNYVRQPSPIRVGRLAIDSGWLVEIVDEHTCGAGPGSGAGHEPGCGTIPVCRLDDLDGWPSSDTTGLGQAEQPDTRPTRSDLEAVTVSRLEEFYVPYAADEARVIVARMVADFPDLVRPDDPAPTEQASTVDSWDPIYKHRDEDGAQIVVRSTMRRLANGDDLSITSHGSVYANAVALRDALSKHIRSASR